MMKYFCDGTMRTEDSKAEDRCKEKVYSPKVNKTASLWGNPATIGSEMRIQRADHCPGPSARTGPHLYTDHTFKIMYLNICHVIYVLLGIKYRLMGFENLLVFIV